MDRLLVLDGMPVMQDARTPLVQSSVPEQLEYDRSLIEHALMLLNEAISCCEQRGDYVIRALFQEMLAGEQQHLHWQEKEPGLIERFGPKNYLQSRIGSVNGPAFNWYPLISITAPRPRSAIPR